MNSWNEDDLRAIAESNDLYISPFREDGTPYSTRPWCGWCGPPQLLTFLVRAVEGRFERVDQSYPDRRASRRHHPTSSAKPSKPSGPSKRRERQKVTVDNPGWLHAADLRAAIASRIGCRADLADDQTGSRQRDASDVSDHVSSPYASW